MQALPVDVFLTRPAPASPQVFLVSNVGSELKVSLLDLRDESNNFTVKIQATDAISAIKLSPDGRCLAVQRTPYAVVCV